MPMSPAARYRRRILCVFPIHRPSFGTFEYACVLRGATRAFMPPQGLLAVAAYLPAAWEARFIDENMRPAGEDEIVCKATLNIAKHPDLLAMRRDAYFTKIFRKIFRGIDSPKVEALHAMARDHNADLPIPA